MRDDGNLNAEASMLTMLERIATALERIADSHHRLEDHFVPMRSSLVGTPYVAQQLGCTTEWITEMIRSGEIPHQCVVPGTGNGKPWKLYRDRIEKWIASR